MTLREFLVGELIDIIEWNDDSDDTMAWRFSRPKAEIKNGAQLIVRPGQTAILVDQGKIADVFQSGRHELTTANMPLLSSFRGWKYGFESPFKADVLFLATKQFVGRKWGTSNRSFSTTRDWGPCGSGRMVPTRFASPARESSSRRSSAPGPPSSWTKSATSFATSSSRK
jgi:hypothetical protein